MIPEMFSTDWWVGSIAVLFGALTLVLSFAILPQQINEIRYNKNIMPVRWGLLVINLGAIITILSPIWGGVELLTQGRISDIIRITSSLSVRLFFLMVVIGMFLIYTRRDK